MAGCNHYFTIYSSRLEEPGWTAQARGGLESRTAEPQGTLAVHNNAYYTSSAYKFGQNVACGMQSAGKNKICSMPTMPGSHTD